MILTGPEIWNQHNLGNIIIDPFDADQLNPNSYNCRLSDELSVYVPQMYSRQCAKELDSWLTRHTPLPVAELNCRYPPEVYTFKIPDEGFLLHPGKLYLGATIERTATDIFVPMIAGRSSLARLGLSIHQTGGFGDIGFDGTWTLELTCVEPLWLYADMQICQVQFWECRGGVRLYQGKYKGQKAPTPSRLHVEFPQNKSKV